MGWRIGNETDFVSSDLTHEFTCVGSMDVTAVFESVKEHYKNDWTGSGTQTDPFVIPDLDGWMKLKDLVENYPAGVTSGLYFALGGDITLASGNTIGTEKKPFCGCLDGKNHTLTYDVNENSMTIGLNAPFSYVQDATFMNIHACGTIKTKSILASGLIIRANGTTTLTNCRSSISITSTYGATSINKDGYHAGFVCRGENLVFTGCIFDGSFDAAPTSSCCGFVGYVYANKTCTFKDCLFVPTLLDVKDDFRPFVRIGSNRTLDLTNCYFKNMDYKSADQGKKPYQVTTNENVAISFGEGNEYDVSGITAYDAGMEYGGSFFAGAGDTVTFTLTSPSDGFAKCSAGTLTLSGSTYQLTMPEEDVVISSFYGMQDKEIVLSETSYT